MKEVQDKQWIKNIIHYLVKWADWSSEYNFYESASHLTDTSKAVINYKHQLKCKQKIKTVNVDEALSSEDLSVSHRLVM